MLEFWMVLVDGNDSPKQKHVTRELAMEEARRLARKTQRPTYVLKAEMLFEVSDVQVTKLQESVF